jgi:hypothetical protein
MANAPTRWQTRLNRVVWVASFIVIVIVTGLLVLWALPSLLVPSEEGMTAAQHLMAVNDARATLVTFALAVGAAGTLFFTGRTFLLTRETQVTERYTRAVSQIGEDNLEVRIGGIYALERIGRDSSADRRTVVFVLGALVRNRSNDGRAQDEEPGDDVYTALRVIGRLAPLTDVTVNLRGADLHKANLKMLHDVRVYHGGFDLTGATLPESWKDADPVGRRQRSGSPPAGYL